MLFVYLRGLDPEWDGWFFGDEIALSRKHTSRLFEDLDEKIEAGFSRIFDEWERNDLRVMSYREHELDDRGAHDLVIRSVDAEALAPSAIPRVLQEYRSPWHSEFVPRNAWSLFNAHTEILKGQASLAGRPHEDASQGLRRGSGHCLGVGMVIGGNKKSPLPSRWAFFRCWVRGLLPPTIPPPPKPPSSSRR